MAVKDRQGEGVLVPQIERACSRVSGVKVERAIGFWVLWHSYGGTQPLIDSGIMSRRAVYYGLGDFVKAMGVHVFEWQPGLAVAVRDGR